MADEENREEIVREDLTKRLKDVKLETLPAFIEYALSQGTGYGEICVAIGAIAAGAAKAADRSPRGGITGFQAGAVFWEFVKQWGVFDDGPKRMVCYQNMLYPQYDHKFEKTITPDTWTWLKEEAAKKLTEPSHPAVRAHWESIVAGTVPFGYTVVDD